MPEAIFLLGLSFLLVVVCLTILLLTAIPTFQELSKAANSIIRLADTLTRDLPATLEAIRMTGLELSELSDELNQGAKNAGEAVKQVNDGIKGVRQGASSASIATKSAFAGIKAGIKSLGRSRSQRRADNFRESLRSNNQSIRDLDSAREGDDFNQDELITPDDLRPE
jgi:methyl-accepting chemotaxis protein